MNASVPGLIAMFFAMLLAVLVVALILRRDFRNAVLGGSGEATVLGLITVKGVAIILLCGILVGGILFALTKLPQQQQTAVRPVEMRFNVHFDPNEVNPGNPKFSAKAFIKNSQGVEPIPLVTQLKEGGLSVRVTLPDMSTPFFIVFETPKGTWRTDDHSVLEAATTARKQQQE